MNQPLSRALLGLALIVYFVLLNVACDQVAKVDNMNNKTTEMNSTTKDLLDTSKELKKSTDTVVKQGGQVLTKIETQVQKTQTVVGQTSELYDLQRQGGSIEVRRKSLEALINAHSAGAKLAQATIYFEAFEFQTFTGSQMEAVADRRETLLADAMNEFFMSLHEYDADTTNVNPFAMKVVENSPLFRAHGHSNQQACFGALSATLHKINRKQTENIQSLGASGNSSLKAESFLSLISQALALESQVDAGLISMNKVSQWQKVVLENRELAVRLLQTRQNVILGIFLNQVLPESGIKNKLIEGSIALDEILPENALSDRLMKALNWAMKFGYNWVLDLDKLNMEQLQTLQQYLRAVQDSRVLLLKLNIKPEINQTMQAFLVAAQLQSKIQSGAALSAARTQLVDLFNQVKSFDEAAIRASNAK